MGFFSDLFGKSIADDISKSISDAVNTVSEMASGPAAEKVVEETVNSIHSAAETVTQCATDVAPDTSSEEVRTEEVNTTADASIFDTVLANFPKWTYTAIEEVNTEEEDEYTYVMVGMKLTDDLVEQYQNVLKQNGFTGSWQIMEKQIGGKAHKIDFSFVSDAYINYYIFK